MTEPKQDHQEILTGLRSILVDDLELNLENEEIPDDVSLLEEGLALDSVVIVELIIHLEKRFDIQFDDRNLRSELFENLTTLASFVAEQRAALSSAA